MGRTDYSSRFSGAIEHSVASSIRSSGRPKIVCFWKLLSTVHFLKKKLQCILVLGTFHSVLSRFQKFLLFSFLCFSAGFNQFHFLFLLMIPPFSIFFIFPFFYFSSTCWIFLRHVEQFNIQVEHCLERSIFSQMYVKHLSQYILNICQMNIEHFPNARQTFTKHTLDIYQNFH